MSLLTDLTAAIQDGGIQVIDLTAPLNDTTPVIRLPEPFGNTATFALWEISRYDDRGLPPAGAVVIAGPLPISGGSGSPCRAAIALVERPAGRSTGRA